MKYTDEYLKSRVTWLDGSDDIMMYHEVRHFSIETIDRFFMEVNKMCKPSPKARYLILDLSEAELPTGELRRHISERFKDYSTIFEAICVFSDKNKLINIAAQFVISFQPELFKGMSIHSDLAHCLTKIENVKRTKAT